MVGAQLVNLSAAGADQGYEGGTIIYVSNSAEGHQGVHAHVHGQWDGDGQW